ncbi:hypothetical protein [[Mycoplasma] gypis]|uniref:Glucose-6-phosphate isomerase n=1 Tax=[Mycoplasma] gypis TaxID=92404 RepID=A0ABZ2RTM9_9BACT|nr:hypothetical protein [[Mycoplasma] gypis]MBN0919611.1 hypothetical protein [[Mycoplasma] gypis]
MNEKIKLNIKNALKDSIYLNYRDIVKDINYKIQNRTCEGQEFLPFLDLQETANKSHDIKYIQKWSKELQKDVEILVVIAPYGLCLQSKAAIDFYFGSASYNNNKNMEIIYVDHILSGRECEMITEYLENRRFAINVISKNGNDIEVLANFKILRAILEQKLGSKNASNYVFITTNANRGKLNQIAQQKNYRMFVFLDSIVEAYSSLTAVGLFPMACAGIDIEKVLKGAKKASEIYLKDELSINHAYCYAVARFSLQKNGLNHEIFVNYDESTDSLSKWWQYIFSESDGKQKRSLYLDTASFSKEISTRLQFVQDGFNNIFQTFIFVDKPSTDFIANIVDDELEGLSSLGSTTQYQLQKMSYDSIVKTNHKIGKIRNIEILVEDDREETIGHWIVFFQNASLMSAFLHGLNPFHNNSYDIYDAQVLDYLKGNE